MKDSDIL